MHTISALQHCTIGMRATTQGNIIAALHRPKRKMRLRTPKPKRQTDLTAAPAPILMSCLVLICCLGTACAEPETPETTGDVEFGAYLASTCASCHSNSAASSGIPPIAGLKRSDFINALKAYKSGERDNPTMQTIAASLSDGDIAALVAYFEFERRNSKHNNR